MTRVRKAAAVSLMTPMVGAAIAVGLSHPAVAAEACPPLASASIKPPTGTVTAGSSVHVSAKISGLMLLQAHLQISGPGLDKQVGKSAASGEIQGDVTVPKAGYFTLAVIGNGTSCTYQTAGFSARERASAVKPTQSSAPSKNPRPGSGGGGNASPGAMGPLPTGTVGAGGAGANNFGLNPLNGASPFSLPSVAPDGSGQGFQYPSPDPQVAAPPPTQPQARNVSETTPIKWGQSLALALVLLVISAHLGMWSRRQRLAAEGARSTGGGKWMARRKTKATPATVAETTALADGPTATAAVTPTSTATDTTAPIATTPGGTAANGNDPSATGPSATDPSSADLSSADPSETAPSSTRAGGTAATGTSLTENSEAETSAPSAGSRSYHGRRRRG